MRFTFPTWCTSWREWINPIPIVVVCVSLIFGWQLIFGDQGLLTWRSLARTKADLDAKERAHQTTLRNLQEEATRLEEPAYLEVIIRQELGYVKPGETVYQLPEEEKTEALSR